MSTAPITTTYTVDFAPKATPRPTVAPTGRVPRVARLLALAHRIAAMIAAGELRDLAHAALVCGVTRPRMTQVMALLLLAPPIQEAILELRVTKGRDPITERNLRPLTTEPVWERQLAMWRNEYGMATAVSDCDGAAVLREDAAGPDQGDREAR